MQKYSRHTRNQKSQYVPTQSRFFNSIFEEDTPEPLIQENSSKKPAQNSESGFSHQLYTFNVLQADGIPGDDILESPALVRTGSEAYAYGLQNPNPANDEKI